MPDDVLSTAFFANSVHQLSQIAGIISNAEDAKRY
jgi:hypothetical protein